MGKHNGHKESDDMLPIKSKYTCSILIAIALTLLAAQSAPAQASGPQPRKFDEFIGEAVYEDESSPGNIWRFLYAEARSGLFTTYRPHPRNLFANEQTHLKRGLPSCP